MILFFIMILIIIIILIINIKKRIKYINCNNDLFIIPNFYDIGNFNKIKNYCKDFIFKDDYRVLSRKTICLKYNDHKKLYDLLYNSKLKDFVKKICNKDLVVPSFPVEYRIYPNNSSGMKMHKDVAIYDNEYYECVLTLENKSTSKFKYVCNNKNKIINPKANTLVLVTPNSILHGVTATNDGYRTILKFVIIFKNNYKNENFYKNYDLCPF